MKLLFCVTCNEVFNLRQGQYQQCSGAHGGGVYQDPIRAQIWGDRRLILLIGFANSSFVDSARAQIRDGDPAELFYYAGRPEVRGRDFKAFIIPESASSVTRSATRQEFDANNT